MMILKYLNNVGYTFSMMKYVTAPYAGDLENYSTIATL